MADMPTTSMVPDEKPIYSKTFTLDNQAKKRVIQLFWLEKSGFNLRDYDAFFQFFEEELKSILRTIALPDDLSSYLATCTLNEVGVLVGELRERPQQTRTETINALSVLFPDKSQDAVKRSLELVVRLWLNINVRTQGITDSSTMPAAAKLKWPDDKSLSDTVASCFTKSTKTERKRIAEHFTASELNRLRGWKIDWVSSLTDHLKSNRSTKIVKIYAHKLILLRHWQWQQGLKSKEKLVSDEDDNERKGHRDAPSKDASAEKEKVASTMIAVGHERDLEKGEPSIASFDAVHDDGETLIRDAASKEMEDEKDDEHTNICLGSSQPIFPDDVLVETLLSLELLFPVHRPQTRKFLDHEGHPFYNIHSLNAITSSSQSSLTDFSQFAYWRDQLEELHDDLTTPAQKKMQLVRDRRNKREFYTLAISLVALLLALILGTMGLVNAEIANKNQKISVKLARRSFDLACAQAVHSNPALSILCQ